MSRWATTYRAGKPLDCEGAATVKAWHQRLEDAEVATAAARAQLREVPCLINGIQRRMHVRKASTSTGNSYNIEMTWLGCKASEMQEKLWLQSSERVQELLDEPLGISDRKQRRPNDNTKKRIGTDQRGCKFVGFWWTFRFPLAVCSSQKLWRTGSFAFSPSVPFDLGRGVFTVGHPSWRKRHGYWSLQTFSANWAVSGCSIGRILTVKTLMLVRRNERSRYERKSVKAFESSSSHIL